MFDELRRTLRKYQRGIKVPVKIPLDDEGHFDRECPSAECLAAFKIHFDDWKQKVRDEAVFCPVCRHEAPSNAWNTSRQVRHYQQVGKAHLHRAIGSALEADSRQFNASQPRGGFIQMSLSYSPGSTPFIIPLEAAEALRQRFECEACRCRYSSVGAAFFCPACGHNSAVTTFATAVKTVRRSVEHLDHICEAVRAAADEDAAADTSRQLLENGLVKLVASFQRYAEATFHKLPTAAAHRVRRNLFQNLAESTALWRAASGKGYEDFLSPSECQELNVLFQQRHVLSHQDGIVDPEYLAKSGDTSYKVGQKLQIRAPAVRSLADLVEKLVAGLKSLIGGP
jgi:hypothetical protein